MLRDELLSACRTCRIRADFSAAPRMHHSHGGFLRCLQPAPFISPAAEAEDDRENILSFFSQAIVVPNRPILIWGALDDAFFLQAGQTGRHHPRRPSCFRPEFSEPPQPQNPLPHQNHTPPLPPPA